METTSPEERRRGGRAGGCVKGAAGRGTVVVGEFATAFGSCYQRVADDLGQENRGSEPDFRAYFFIFVKVINMTNGHITEL